MKSVFDKNFSSMILSASGWRMVFAASGDEEDSAAELTEEKAALAVLAAQAFADCFEIHKKPLFQRAKIVQFGEFVKTYLPKKVRNIIPFF